MVLFIIVLFSSGCIGRGPSYSNPQAIVDVDWLSQHVGDEGIKVIHVGNRVEYDEGHIPNALFVDWSRDIADPRSEVENMVAPVEQVVDLLGSLGLENDDTIVVYDEGINILAGRMFWVLKYYGHKDIRLLSGGRKAWTDSGRSLTKEVPVTSPKFYSAGAINTRYRATLDEVLESLRDPNVILVDVRTPGEYEGKTITAARNGHIPGAINVEWRQAVNQDGTIKDAGSLKELYEKAGVRRDKKVIVYCTTGVRSAFTWYVLNELLGYPDVVLYDGSWADWGNNPTTPVVVGKEPG